MAKGKPSETPLMRQFLDIKAQHPDAIVFFRLGDFYEMFFDDAVLAAKLLDLTLTTRDKGKEDAVAMCGVPHHAARGYINKLIGFGHRVVICEQTEDPKLCKGLVKREVVRIVTPGVTIDEEALDPRAARYVAALAWEADSPEVGLAYLDVTTGEFRATQPAVADLADELRRVAPAELVVARHMEGLERVAPGIPVTLAPWDAATSPADFLRSQLQLERDAPPLATLAAAMVLHYAQQTQPGGSLPVARLAWYRNDDTVVLDEAAVANLELVETIMGRRREGSLLHVLDATCTAAGARLLRRWLLFPLLDVAAITARQNAVAALLEQHEVREALQHALRAIPDLERLAGRARLRVASPRDLGKLRDGLLALPAVASLVAPLATHGSVLHDAALIQPCLAELAQRLVAMLADTLPPMLKDGDVVRAGVDAVIDECRALASGGKAALLAIEEREQKATGIGTLKVRYNRVFGYYIEISKGQLAKAPAHYMRKQTIANGERFVTPELAELERRVLAAEDTLLARETELFAALVDEVAALGVELAEAAASLAVCDVIASLADVAHRHGYVRPRVDASLALDIRDGRHPVIERKLPAGAFVPNDCVLQPTQAQLLLITGPNMAGKSTYMRQVALTVLMAQMGSFVAAASCHVGVCDRVFTRVGASDNVSAGDSTFMVEMRETGHILTRASKRSLVILDEVGRGTSTYDGLSIAWAVTEYLHDVVFARTLFATHYHELVSLAQSRPRVRPIAAAVAHVRGEVVFLRRMVPGGASKSYGIEVAKAAGLPRSVIARAKQLLGQLEEGQALGGQAQLSLLHYAPTPAPSDRELTERLLAIDVDDTSPREALRLLAELRALAHA